MILLLLNLAEVASVGSVCVQWRLIVTSFVSDLGLTVRHRPWLVLSDRPYDQAITLMNPLHRSTSSWARRFCGAFGDWLAISDRFDGVYLFHPILHHHVQLPTLPLNIPNTFFEPSIYRSPLLIRKVILSSPPTSTECMVAIIFGDKELAFCRLGDGSWQELEPKRKRRYDDAVFYNGRLFAVDIGFHVWAFGFRSGQVEKRLLFVPGLFWSRGLSSMRFLVESMGQLLMVVRRRRKVSIRRGMMRRYVRYNTSSFQVFQIGVDRMGCRQLFSLGNRVMFLGRALSTVVASDEIEEDFGSDCIYFAECENLYPLDPKDTGVFCMANRRGVRFNTDDEAGAVWRWGHRAPLFFAMFNMDA